MQKQKVQNVLLTAIIASEFSHVFCCVLPTVFSVLSLLAGVGMVSAMPGWMIKFHNTMHEWEIPMIAFAGIVMLLGWLFYWYSRKIDCHDMGCCHEPCDPRKNKANLILKIATLLFFINVTVYAVFHRGMGVNMPDEHGHVHETHAGHHDLSSIVDL